MQLNLWKKSPPNSLGSSTDEREEDDDNDEAIAHLLEDEGEGDDDDMILPLNPSSLLARQRVMQRVTLPSSGGARCTGNVPEGSSKIFH